MTAPRVLILTSALDSAPRCVHLARPMTIAEVVAVERVNLGLPTIAVMTDPAGRSVPILRGEWHVRQVTAGYQLSFVPVPGRGALRSILAALASIALAIVAPWAAGALAGVLGFQAGTAAFTIASGIIGSGIMIAGQFILNRLLPPPSRLGSADPVYTARASGNRASPNEPIPLLYGRLRYPAPYASRPYAEFVDNDQYLYQLHCISVGYADVDRWEIGETLVWTLGDGFTEAFAGGDTEIEIIRPGEEITLFPANVVTASTVAGQQVPDEPEVLGPFTVNAAGTEISRIVCDYVFPLGLVAINDEGGGDPETRTVYADYREIDENGDPLGPWQSLFSETHTAATRTPQRFSRGADVPLGRYEVQLGASGSDHADATGGPPTRLNRVVWGSLRGYVTDFVTPADCTLVATKIKATEHLAQEASGQYFYTCQRRLPVWDEVNGWSAPVATRSPAWAVADVLKRLGLTDSEFDLGWLAAYAAVWETRGDKFDGLFDRRWQASEAIDAVLRVGRSYHVRLGSIIGFVRDEPRLVRRVAFTPDAIVRGSIRRHDIWFSEDAPDHLEVIFLDGETWRERSLIAAIGAVGQDKPQELTLFGVTDHDHAWREGIFQAAENAFRRSFRTFQVEREGRTLVRGDAVLLHDPLHEVAGFGRVEAIDGDMLELDRPAAEPIGPWNFDADGEGWGTAADGSGELAGFVDHALLGRAVEHQGIGAAAIRQAAAIVPEEEAIYELQVVWNAINSGARVRARLVSLGAEGQVLATVGEYATTAADNDGYRITKWLFAAEAGDGIDAVWHADAASLRFGVDLDQAADQTVRVGEVRVRRVVAVGEHVTIRDRRGREWGPCAVIGSRRLTILHLDHDDRVQVETDHGALTFVLPDPATQEPAHATILQGDDRLFDGLVVEARPVGADLWEVTLVNDDQRVHAVDETEVVPSPWTPPPIFAPPPDAPPLDGLYAAVLRGTLGLELQAGWLPAAGANRYVAQISYDEDAETAPASASWTPVHDSAATRLAVTVMPQPVTLRVAAIGKLQGAWSYRRVTSIPELLLPEPIIDPIRDWFEDSREFAGEGRRESRERMRQLALYGMEQDGQNVLDKRELTLAMQDELGNKASLSLVNSMAGHISEIDGDIEILGVSMTEIQAALTGYTGENAIATAFNGISVQIQLLDGELTAISEDLSVVEAEVDEIASSVTVRAQAGAGPGGGWTRYAIELKTEDAIWTGSVGLYMDVHTDGTRRIMMDAATFVFGDLSTGEIINPLVFENGVWRMNIAHIGTVTSGVIRSPDSLMVIDLSNAAMRWY